MGFSAFFIARRFYCGKNLRNLHPIFLLVIYDCTCLYRLARRPRVSFRATCVILALVVAVESSVPLTYSVHGTLSPLTNRFLL